MKKRKSKGNFTRLVGFELRKAFLNPWMLVFLAVLLLMNGWKLWEAYENKVEEWHGYESVYEDFYRQWKGPITAEHITELMTIYGPLKEKSQNGGLSYTYSESAYTYSEALDNRFFNTLFAREMEYDYLYQNEAVSIVTDAKKLADKYAAVGNHYRVRENKQIIRTFAGRKIPAFADTRWAEVWLNHDYSAMLVLLLTVFGLCGVFVTERESQMYMLQRASKLGGGATVMAKFTASALFVVTVCLLFFGEDLLMLLVLSGHPEALDSPVYAIRLMETTPLNMTVGQFCLWSMVVRSFGVLVCGMFVLLLSCIATRVLYSFVAGFGAMMAFVILQENCRAWAVFKWFDPLELVMVRDLVSQTTFVNVLGFPVHTYLFVLTGILLTGACVAAGILHCNPGRMERGRRYVSV